MRRYTVKSQNKSSIESYQKRRRHVSQRRFPCASSSEYLDEDDYSNLAESSPFTQKIRLLVGSELSGRRVA